MKKFIKKILEENVLLEKDQEVFDKDGELKIIKLYYNPQTYDWTPIKDFALKGLVFSNISPIIEDVLKT